MPTVSLAFFWHQHQPYYPDLVGGENPMPWVRLHGAKDYWGMAWHIKEVPEFRCTINLVPSLLLQLQGYVDGTASDRHLDVSRMPADSLGEAEAKYLLDNFFMANLDSMIRPYARYNDLLFKRGVGIDPVERALPRFNARDLRDLQVWGNLTWFHPILFEIDAELQAFRQKGQNWTETDKQWLLQKQRDVLRQIVPLHRELMEGGQVELTTTPFYHPILPLLWDKRSARQAMPNCPLPKSLDSYADDARIHLKRAVESHEKLFGVKPKGMWPSEGSVSQEILAAIADVGIEWIATDEEILAASTNGWVSRDGNGYLRHPELLYRPWKAEEQGKSLQMIFRDHALSDLIGFHYQRMDAGQAANDLLGKVESIGRAVEGPNAGRPALVPVILDGENCWEYFLDGGVQFLRTLYRSCVQRHGVKPVRVSDALREAPATDRIQKLFAGSWISHNFAIWIGHEDDVTAWDLLHDTRDFLLKAAESNRFPADAIQAAWEEIYIAEGSDWFWWFGDDHSSAQDALFDQLFRKHLKNVYILLKTAYPPVLDRPISRVQAKPVHTQPKGFLTVRVDGRRTFFEWINAGLYVAGSERGTMTMVTHGPVRHVQFGFDPERLLIRVDTANPAVEELREVDELRVSFLEPAGWEIRVHGFSHGQLQALLYLHGKNLGADHLEAAVGRICELGVKLDSLRLGPEQRIEFAIELFSRGNSIDRVPKEGLFVLSTPSPEFELLNWQV